MFNTINLKEYNEDWIGSIPLTWNKKKLKYLVEYNNEVLDEDTSSDYEFNYIEINNVNLLSGVSFSDKIKFGDSPSRARRLVRKEDIIISTVRTYLKSICIIPDKPDLVCSTGFCVIRSNKELLESKYLYYSVISNWFIERVISESKGVSYPAITPTDLVQLEIVHPPLSDQKLISRYLDRKTQEIDLLLGKIEKKIDLLTDKKNILINKFITKGINLDLEMKDSGIDSIGYVPKHWENKRLKYLLNYKKGFAFKSSLFLDIGTPVIKASDIKKSTIRNPSFFINPELIQNYKDVQLNKGDLLISTVGSKYVVKESAVGQIALVPEELDGALLNQNTVCLRLNDDLDIDIQFIFYYLQTFSYRAHLDIHSHGTANQASINLDDILNYEIFLPSYKEQREIIQYISNELKNLDEVINLEQKRIKTFLQYRQSLISSVVTGKIRIKEEMI
tara:strand:- start:247 stop:1590 length:1344 start_codon:yes stop_codon:yes gene_type:complete